MTVYNYRLAEPKDREVLLHMCLEFFKATAYAELDYIDNERVLELIDWYLASPNNENIIVIMEHQDVAVGLISMLATTSLFNRELIAVEQIWWVAPEHRKAKNSMVLMHLVEEWAKKVGCTRINLTGLNSSTDVSKLYEKKGFTQTEYSYYKRID